ncbi:MAG: hypothetical protein EOP45_11665 [Sphingobacteriaceae bacterium]|nr:MAG: hypothetical protein EOP45_11665 [Sphingobacteriaceae bacterium]
MTDIKQDSPPKTREDEVIRTIKDAVEQIQHIRKEYGDIMTDEDKLTLIGSMDKVLIKFGRQPASARKSK